MTNFQIYKKIIFLEVFKDLSNNFGVVSAIVFSINKDIVQVNNKKKVKLFN